jgi:hypothetical protein
LFISWRKIIQGYDGYEYPPHFTDDAKQLLMEDGKEAFSKYYGDYYVKGCVNGASMRTVIRTERTSTSGSETMDLNIRAGWNGGFMTVGGGGGFT